MKLLSELDKIDYLIPTFTPTEHRVNVYREDYLRAWAIEQVKELKHTDNLLHPDNNDRLVEGKWCILMELFELKESDLK